MARDFLAAVGLTPADAVWQLHGHYGQRMRLADLPYTDHVADDFDPTWPAEPVSGPQGQGPVTNQSDPIREGGTHPEGRDPLDGLG